MRFAVAALSASVVLACWTGPEASAETVVLPERPADGPFVSTDNPSIVDQHPMEAESWSRVGNDHALAVHFSTGTPECFGVHATVTETAESVNVELRGGTLPEAVGRACIMLAVFGTLEVPLQSPVGDREVLSVY